MAELRGRKVSEKEEKVDVDKARILKFQKDSNQISWIWNKI